MFEEVSTKIFFMGTRSIYKINPNHRTITVKNMPYRSCSKVKIKVIVKPK